MATITIKSDKADDIYFINELARRLNLETEIKTPDNEIGVEQFKPVIDYEDTPKGIVKNVKHALKEVKEARTGKRKLQTLDELLDEY